MKARRLAVLIDGDNISTKLAARLLPLTDEISDHVAFYVFGAGGNSTAGKWWGSALEAAGAQEIHVRRGLSGKNAAELAITARGMDLLHRVDVDGFLIVSCDGHLAHLAEGLRQTTPNVWCCGQAAASRALINACAGFIDLDEWLRLRPDTVGAIPPEVRLITDKMLDASNGRVPIAVLGGQLAKYVPGYGKKPFGYKTLTRLIEALGDYEIDGKPERRYVIRPMDRSRPDRTPEIIHADAPEQSDGRSDTPVATPQHDATNDPSEKKGADRPKDTDRPKGTEGSVGPDESAGLVQRELFE